jgi:hypothetical protein
MMTTGAYYLALMADAAYEPTKSYPLLPRFVWNYSTTEYVEIRVEGKTAFIVFRGSDDIIDWIRNADLHFVASAYGEIHHGFYRGWQELKMPVLTQLAKLAIDRVVIVCHSRGGPIGIQCHEYLDRTRPELVVSTVTFGCPRFCDKDFERRCDDDLDIVNYIHGVNWIPFFRDPVPHLPASQRRPGKDVYLGGFGRPDRMHRIGSYVNRLER